MLLPASLLAFWKLHHSAPSLFLLMPAKYLAAKI
jgi:hypothetical protein